VVAVALADVQVAVAATAQAAEVARVVVAVVTAAKSVKQQHDTAA
jgi:hypothetical protein